MQDTGHFGTDGPGSMPQNYMQIRPEQLVSFILKNLQRQDPPQGWRAGVNVQERVRWIKQLYVQTNS